MRLIIIPLFILILVSVSVQMINFMPLFSGGEYSIGMENYDQSLATIGLTDLLFDITIIAGFIGLMVGSALVGIIAGLEIEVLGSTIQISEQSQKILQTSMFYLGLWGVFSVLATTGILGLGLFSIPIFGILFYIILTLLYVLGIQQQINKG